MNEQDQFGHPQFADDLALYALGALEAESVAVLEAHLKSCATCRQELAKLGADAALLALSASASVPPVRARQRLLDAIRQEPTRAPLPVGEKTHPALWSPASVFAILTLLVVLIAWWRDDSKLRLANHELQAKLISQAATSAHARELLALLAAKDTVRMTLVESSVKLHPHGKAIYQARTGRVVFLAMNLAPMPPHKTYELWLLPIKGVPLPAGTFKPDSHGDVMIMPPPLPAGTEAKNFAITIEDERGSSSPTTPILLMGAGPLPSGR